MLDGHKLGAVHCAMLVQSGEVRNPQVNLLFRSLNRIFAPRITTKHGHLPMQDIPLVSVILPNYNYARYLEARIKGILNQTYANIELILLDDKSSDNSVEIMQRYGQHPKVAAVIVNNENSGSPFRQWSKGISLARGKYIWIAEADDEAAPTFLSVCVQAMEQHPSAPVCYTSSRHIDSEGRVLANRHPSRQSAGYDIYNGMDFCRHNLYWRNYIENASGVVFRRDAYEQCKDERWIQMRSSGDWLFWFLMCRQGDVIRIHEPLNHFRLHEVSTTVTAKRNGNSFIEDAQILHIMEQTLPPLGIYRHYMRVGQLFRFIRKARLSPERQHEVEQGVESILGISPKVRPIEAVNRLLRWIPGTVTMKSDALPGTQ